MQQDTFSEKPERTEEPSLYQLVLYFFRLGSLGFGGPIALANYMRRDLVEQNGWLKEQEYNEGLAIATACPGPLAYQLAVYCGYIRYGLTGSLAVAVAFALTPFLLVVASASLYVRFAGNWQLRALFYGIAPVVIALILKACLNLGRKTLQKDIPAWTIALVSCAVTVVIAKELTVIFLVGGAIGIFLFSGPAASSKVSLAKETAPPPMKEPPTSMLAVAAGSMTMSGLTLKLYLFFLKTGFLVFGSGLVIVPFLKAYVVDQYHWIQNRPFLDAVAVGMISPGPVVITAPFIGYLVNGFPGATASALGIFTPGVVLTVLGTPILRRYRSNRRLQGFIRGVTVAVVGVLVGTTYLVAKTAIGDWVTLAVAVASFVVLQTFKKFPEQALVLAGALVGLIAYPLIQPEWLLK